MYEGGKGKNILGSLEEASSCSGVDLKLKGSKNRIEWSKFVSSQKCEVGMYWSPYCKKNKERRYLMEVSTLHKEKPIG